MNRRPCGAQGVPEREERPFRWALAAVALALAGIAVSAAGRRAGIGFLDRFAGPAITAAGAALWVGHRLLRRRKRRP